VALDVVKRRIGRLERQIKRTSETQANRKTELAKLKAKAKSAK
jgi:hypothetical protein